MELFEEQIKPGKGRALKVILIIAIILRLLDFILITLYLFIGKVPFNLPMLAWEMSLYPRGFFILTIITDIAFIIICILILLRKKWGVYALGSLLVVQAIIPLFVYKGIPLSSVLPSLIVTGFIFIILLSLWSDYV